MRFVRNLQVPSRQVERFLYTPSFMLTDMVLDSYWTTTGYYKCASVPGLENRTFLLQFRRFADWDTLPILSNMPSARWGSFRIYVQPTGKRFPFMFINVYWVHSGQPNVTGKENAQPAKGLEHVNFGRALRPSYPADDVTHIPSPLYINRTCSRYWPPDFGFNDTKQEHSLYKTSENIWLWSKKNV